MINTPEYNPSVKCGARRRRRRDATPQNRVELQRRVEGRNIVERRTLNIRPKHIPLEKKESVRAALKKIYIFLTFSIILFHILESAN
jgi:hypothetical protein